MNKVDKIRAKIAKRHASGKPVPRRLLEELDAALERYPGPTRGDRASTAKEFLAQYKRR